MRASDLQEGTGFAACARAHLFELCNLVEDALLKLCIGLASMTGEELPRAPPLMDEHVVLNEYGSLVLLRDKVSVEADRDLAHRDDSAAAARSRNLSRLSAVGH